MYVVVFADKQCLHSFQEILAFKDFMKYECQKRYFKISKSDECL